MKLQLRTPDSGVFRFMDIEDGEYYIYELSEIPEKYHGMVKNGGFRIFITLHNWSRILRD